MNIYYIGSPQLFGEGASSIHVAKMCEAFSNEGHYLELVLPINSKKVDDFFRYYNVKNKFKINPTIGFKSGSLRHVFHGIISFFKMLPVNEYDFIVTRNITFAFLMSFLKSRIIIDIHHPPVNFFSKIATERFFKSKNIIKITCNSNGTMQNLTKDISRSKKLQVLHNGVNIDEFNLKSDSKDLRKSLNISEKFKIVSYIGNTYKGRGIEKIIELSKINKDIFFLIVGGEESDNKIYLDDLKNNQENLLFTGHVKNSDIPNYLAISDVLLIPYDHDFTIKGGSKAVDYSSPIKLFEYMASGKPIIASDLPAISEILSNRINSLLVNPDSIDELNQAINNLLSNKDLIKDISLNSLKLSKEFTWTSRARKMIMDLK